ncbi:MAG: HlyD family efflux transporter periplasmic adaptor subunit, partial [Bacteroidia bacterium]|nr:HlyD family efflux transporter periplasmic adaptor subunit [Bacteroidia bacterium]
MMKKILKIITEHKIIAGIIIILILFGSYSGYKAIKSKSAGTSYVTSAAEKGTLVVSVSGSGQISASNQVDIKSKVSGDVIYVGIKNGQDVGAGALLVQLDASDAQKTVRDAEANLENAKLSLEKLIGPEGLAVPKNKESAQDDLKKGYDDEFNTIANAFVDLPTVIAGLQGIVLGYDLNPNQWNVDYYEGAVVKYDENVSQYRDEAYTKYQTARKLYNENFQKYKLTNRDSDVQVIDDLASQTYETTRAISDTVKSVSNLIQFYKDKLSERNLTPKTLADTHLTSLNTYMSKTNTHLTNLLSAQNSIKNYKDEILNADLDIESQNLAIKQKEDALLDAKEKLANYFIYAPFAGTITAVDVKKGDTVSGTVATLITKKRIAKISLNEVDVAKVKVGQKVNLTFDAISDLTLTGEVTEVDAVGTVSQGVV